MIINKCGKFYQIKPQETETIKHLIERSWFIVNNLHLDSVNNKTQEEYENSEKESRLWYNLKVLGCTYDNKTQKKIEEIEEKIFV